MPQIGPLEIIVILLVALVVFGPSRLPEVGKQAARGLREFKRFQTGIRSDLQGMLDSDDERDAKLGLERDDALEHDPDDDDAEPSPPAAFDSGPPALESGPVDAEPPKDAPVSGNDVPPADASQ